ncbi:Alternative complex III protein ActB [Ignavibacterium album JCM 16511]|uniref:Alternative complex III protein ActB n=1 Tax=Ignavibacterium album (strain DSM 19864 / JCM 16511 / NBRC 101810 / Mat9-16) TaxID=945713 RepID=I0AJE1_IGNAJ|nr:TAT-variant-translocated molybdopterin oxidoreductase [Ignavibacterium album]AFH49098.1 Alternative complex III protein ActB [Ignavibacterium album JCM 16511]
MSDYREELNSQNNNPDPNYWRSFEELYRNEKTLEAKHHEFAEGVTDEFDPNKNLSGISRRKFLALLGASAALAGVACSDYRDKGEIVPYNVKPEEIILGKPNYYASTCTACANSCGILIKTREGRPIKVDGNPEHPVNQGKICSKGQANILNLYDPERLQQPLKRTSTGFDSTEWKKADSEIIAALSMAGSKEIAVVTHSVTSPTFTKVLEDFKAKFPSTKIYSYELFNNSNRKSAWFKCYGSRNFPLIKWNEAKVIVALESDFLGVEGNRIENSRMFAEGRDVKNKSFNRLYVIESSMTLTGMNADYRMRLKPELQFAFVMSLINELNKRGTISTSIASAYSLDDFIQKNNLDKERVNYLVNDLIANKSKSIIHAGDLMPENVHIAVNILNELLGNKTLYIADSSSVDMIDLASFDDIKELTNKIKNDQVAVVIHLDSNPVYHFPNDFNYKGLLTKVPTVVTLTERMNETAQFSNYVLPINHNFESWGDAKTRTGVISLQQPVIAPLHKTRQKESILLTWIHTNPDSYSDTLYHDYLMNNWETNIYPTLKSKLDFKQLWFGALHDGFALTNESAQSFGSINLNGLNLIDTNSDKNGMTLILRESYQVGDGRFANNGWLQELPHPVSKITWDNYAAISHNTAKALNVQNDDLIEINVGNRKLTLPVFIQAGNADDTITVELGYGREFSGVVASGVGFNANLLLSSEADISNWIYSNVSVTKAGGKYSLASTQEHHSFDDPRTKDLHLKRHIIQEGTVKLYEKKPDFIQEHRPKELESVYTPFQYNEMKWGMAIDLNKCLGCGDCIVACNVENNVPVVGKDQVLKSREMQWLRIDRYYSGSPDDPRVSVQPMLCQHCDQAPCENVCPVVATTHSPDGLNQMVYNRCVGTRYCSNNCPYKVRRFNFFNFRDHFRDGYQESSILSLMFNPEVTVRSRGVMEKCTFCVQRIEEARSEATRKGVAIKGTDVKTACQEACPTNAIHFGDINGKDSEFYKYRTHELGYYVLEELNVRPNITYIAKLRNIHTEEL